METNTKINYFKSLEEYGENHNVYEVTTHVKNMLNGQYPQKPRKPILPQAHSSRTAEIYTQELRKYESEILLYNDKLTLYKAKESEIYAALEEYIKKEAGFYNIPEQYRGKAYSYAYDRGHSAGHYEVYLILIEVVGIFR